MIKICVECGKEYEAKTIRSKYCCGKCKSSNRGKRLTNIKNCKWCGKEFIEFVNKGEKDFCSFSCGSKFMHNNMEEKVLNCSICGTEFLFKGSTKKLYCEECRKKVSVKNTNKYNIKIGKISPDRVGIGSGNGQGVLQDNIKYKTGIGVYRKIKKLSMEELKCEMCGRTDNLHVHHIDEDRNNNDIENLELLCKPCHKNKHMGGDKNYFAKLTWEKVNSIREKIKNGISVKSLMEEYEIAENTIYRIKNNKSWKV